MPIPGMSSSSEPQGLLSPVLFSHLSFLPSLPFSLSLWPKDILGFLGCGPPTPPQTCCMDTIFVPKSLPPSPATLGSDAAGREGHSPLSGDHQQTLSVPSLWSSSSSFSSSAPQSRQVSGQAGRRWRGRGVFDQQAGFHVHSPPESSNALGLDIQRPQAVQGLFSHRCRSLPAVVNVCSQPQKASSASLLPASRRQGWPAPNPPCTRIGEGSPGVEDTKNRGHAVSSESSERGRATPASSPHP